jgi:Cellulose biosynthesis GIL
MTSLATSDNAVPIIANPVVKASSIPSARFQERHIAFAGTVAEFGVNSRWLEIDDSTLLLKAASMLKAGTVVLPYSIATGFRSLARLVAAIRDLDNESIRIVIREQNKRLRLSQTTSLLKLGISMVLPKDMPAASARLQVHVLEGSRYSAFFRRDVERVVRESRFLQTKQRLDATEFRLHAETLLDPKEQDLPHTLVVLHPMTTQGAEAITSRLAQGLRDGVYYSHPEGIWILLMACKPLDCQHVLERVLGQRFEGLLMGWRKMGNPAHILKAIQAMDSDQILIDLLAA